MRKHCYTDWCIYAHLSSFQSTSYLCATWGPLHPLPQRWLSLDHQVDHTEEWETGEHKENEHSDPGLGGIPYMNFKISVMKLQFHTGIHIRNSMSYEWNVKHLKDRVIPYLLWVRNREVQLQPCPFWRCQLIPTTCEARPGAGLFKPSPLPPVTFHLLSPITFSQYRTSANHYDFNHLYDCN